MTLGHMRAKEFILTFAAIFFALTAGGASAEFEGIQLRAACVADEPAQQIFCRSYVFEIARSLNTGAVVGGRRCIPDGVDQSQLVLIVKKFLDERPERWHDPADALVSIAIFKAFHCA